MEGNRENSGKLISAFANTGGGTIVWGVECKDGRANRAEPIPEIASFVQQLNTHSGGITDPPVIGVESFGIEDVPGSRHGFAVTVVPESNAKPHQCVASNRSRCYWMRVGSNVEFMPHSIVRALMLERQQPIVGVEGRRPGLPLPKSLKDNS